MIKQNPEIIFEDEWLLVVMKPAGLVVNRADSVAEETLQDWTQEYLKITNSQIHKSTNQIQITNDKEQVFVQRSGIAHRLDKETSGVMVIGKTPESLANLMAQFKARETKKEYLALVHGRVEPKENIINLPLGRSLFNRHKFRVDLWGKSALTGYRVEQYFPDYSLVRLFPKTGRTHQIRVHMAHIGYPLVGDEVYCGRKRADKDRLWCTRHFLHAAKLDLTHPQTHQIVQFEAPLPHDLQEALDAITRV